MKAVLIALIAGGAASFKIAPLPPSQRVNIDFLDAKRAEHTAAVADMLKDRHF